MSDHASPNGPSRKKETEAQTIVVGGMAKKKCTFAKNGSRKVSALCLNEKQQNKKRIKNGKWEMKSGVGATHGCSENGQGMWLAVLTGVNRNV